MAVGDKPVKTIKKSGQRARRNIVFAEGSNLTITESVDSDDVTWTFAATGGGGTSDHAALSSNLAWSTSAHTGTASRLAGFDGGGAASYYAIGTDIQAYHATLASIAAGTWTGAASILTVGTVGTGVWQGTAVGATYGGTGQTSYTVGDLLYADTTTTLAKLGIGTEGYVMSVVSGVPAWATVATTIYGTQTITGSTGTITAGRRVVFLTHASPTITLPAIYTAGLPLEISGPIGTASYAFIVCAGSDEYDTGATGIRISGAGYRVRLVSDGTTWRVHSVVGVCELPVVSIDLTGIAGASPWTVTNAYTGGTMALTDRSISSTASSASSGLVLTASLGTATWGSGTGTAASLDLADLGLGINDEWAIVGVYAIAGAWTANDTVNGVLGTVISTTMAGCQTLNASPSASLRWGGTATNISHGTVTAPNAIGVWNRGPQRAVRALSGAVTGTFGSAWTPLQVSDPGGTFYQLLDPNALTASQANWKAVFTRFIMAATAAASANTFTFSGVYAVRIIRG